MRTGKARSVLGSLAIVTVVLPLSALAQRHHPLPHPVGQTRAPRPAALSAAAAADAAKRGVSPWTPLTNQPLFLANGASNPILMQDGSVLIQDTGFPDWWKLTPDEHGSYVHGTWTQVASLPFSAQFGMAYAPLFHSSAVLPDGRLIIMGGEYQCDPAALICTEVFQTGGAIYDPIANTWTTVKPPAGWTTIGNGQSVVLANGRFMQANCCTKQEALLNAKTLTWTATGAHKFDHNDDEGWTLLPDGKLLTVDAYVPNPLPYIPDGTNSELYDPLTGGWSSAGSTVAQLWDSAAQCGAELVATFQVGPAVLRPDGTVFATGASRCPPANTAIYDTHSGTWHAGPQFADGLNIAEGPAALEPNGRVLMMASPEFQEPPATFMEWDGQSLTTVPGPPNASVDSSFPGDMLVLPTGQILLTDFSNDIEIYTPARASKALEKESAPVVLFAPRTVFAGGSFFIFGVGFNGVSQGAADRDVAQASTNYPITRITNLRTGHVFYARTHDPSSMAVASPNLVVATVDVPAAQEPGPSKLEVIANGVASEPVLVKVF